MNKTILNNPFTNKIGKEIAEKNFAYILDGILGYSDPDYTMDTHRTEFHTNFEEDLVERGIAPTDFRLRKCEEHLQKLKTAFEKYVRNKYYKS